MLEEEEEEEEDSSRRLSEPESRSAPVDNGLPSNGESLLMFKRVAALSRERAELNEVVHLLSSAAKKCVEDPPMGGNSSAAQKPSTKESAGGSRSRGRDYMVTDSRVLLLLTLWARRRPGKAILGHYPRSRPRSGGARAWQRRRGRGRRRRVRHGMMIRHVQLSSRFSLVLMLVLCEPLQQDAVPERLGSYLAPDVNKRRRVRSIRLASSPPLCFFLSLLPPFLSSDPSIPSPPVSYVSSPSGRDSIALGPRGAEASSGWEVPCSSYSACRL
eukprot:757522-Hanusia_phi.AAC.1